MVLHRATDPRQKAITFNDHRSRYAIRVACRRPQPNCL